MIILDKSIDTLLQDALIIMCLFTTEFTTDYWILKFKFGILLEYMYLGIEFWTILPKTLQYNDFL